MKKFELKLIGTQEVEDENSKSTRYEYAIGNYRAYKDVTVYKNGSNPYESIFIAKNWELRYLPDIYFHNLFYKKDDEKTFTIQTTSYGSLNAEEIQKVVEGYQEALEVVKVLTESFLK